MKAVKKIVPGVDVSVSYLTNAWYTNSIEGNSELTGHPQLPFFRTVDNVCVTRWELTWPERLRLLLTGSLWHTVSLANVAFEPFRLYTKCPVSTQPDGDKNFRSATVTSIMSGSGMFPDNTEASIGVLQYLNGHYAVLNHPELGPFSSENEALAALGDKLRKQNRKKGPFTRP